MGMDLGIKLDFRNYSDYYSKFTQDIGGTAGCVELYLSWKNVKDSDHLKRKADEACSWLSEQGVRIFGFHYPVGMLASEVSWRTDTGQSLPEKGPRDQEEARDAAYHTLDVLAKHCPNGLLVIHQSTPPSRSQPLA
ncbi:hypothetical protein GF351_00495 [Candidatus Woesearchaeota archaeon]|nr:hypothetical protein [Candidatus Woesearchaeota archaeon]